MATGCVAAGEGPVVAKSCVCRRQLVLGNGGSSWKFSNRSLQEPPFGTVLEEVGWRWPPLSRWLSVKEGAWVTVAAAQQAMTYGGCHCFTALTEKFIQRSGADRGTDELAQTLNYYLCDILEEMLIFGGDILKFAGDAVLVLWRTGPQELAKTISLVLQCSWQIQKKCGSRDTHVGQKVQLKIGISAGSMSLLTVGDKRRQYFLICGQALGEVCEAEQLANAGEVILSATSWELCEQHRLRTKRLAGKRAVKLGQSLLLPPPSRGQLCPEHLEVAT
ncbi:adenylate cyclase type 10-like [Aptenodytes patagonicus]|uniref:adenylate cyclase type 10-like n=1 Tax=Aptenodytes patagonicus TaxID=9234 RepID=UPI003FA09E7E